jgi:hypothetical protein
LYIALVLPLLHHVPFFLISWIVCPEDGGSTYLPNYEASSQKTMVFILKLCKF